MTHPGPDAEAEPHSERSETQGPEHAGSTTAVQQAEPAAPEAAEPSEPTEPSRPSGPSGQRPLWQRRRPLLIGIAVAVVVLVGAGVGTAVAIGNASDQPGSSSPQDAATKLITDVGHNDLLGVIDDLPPNEAAVLRSTANDLAGQLKRIGVAQQKAATQAATGLTLKTSGIRFGSGVEQVNSHIAIVNLVAGTITINARLAANNATAAFLRSAFPGGVTGKGVNYTVNAAQVFLAQGHQVGIATVQQNGRWYPSLFYSVANADLEAHHQQWPDTALPAHGADVPNEAVEDAMQEVLDGDMQTVLERMLPGQLPVFQDMGQALADRTPARKSGVLIGPITFDDVHVPGGIATVMRSMTLAAKNGSKTVVTRANGCYTVQAGGKQSQLCAGDFAKRLDATPVAKALPPAVLTFLDNTLGGPVRDGLSVVTTKSHEEWYINPGFTLMQLAHQMSGSLTQQGVVGMVRQGH